VKFSDFSKTVKKGCQESKVNKITNEKITENNWQIDAL